MLESLFPFEFVERRLLYAVLLGVCYSVIALGISVIIFPSDPSLISIAILVLLLYPTLQKILLEHEKVEASRYHRGIFSFFKEHTPLLLFYLVVCLSVFFVYFAFSFVSPQTTGALFAQQERVVSSLSDSVGGGYLQDTFLYYVRHNFGVLLVVFCVAFILGEGGMLLLSWNASSWGVYYGASLASVFGFSGKSLSFLLAVLPHIVLELSMYVVVAITASILSKAFFGVHAKKIQRRNVVADSAKAMIVALGLLIVAALVETFAFSFLT